MTRPDATPGRLVMLRCLGLGDFLTAVPAYRALRAAYPAHETILATRPCLAPLAELTGVIDRVLPARELEPLDWTGPSPDIAVNLHGSGPITHRIVEALGARQAMVYASPQAPHAIGPWWHPAEHDAVRWCRLLEWYGIPADPADLHLAPPEAAPRGRALPTGAIVVHPGAASAGRRWPADRFTAVTRALSRGGHHVVVTGTAEEHSLGLRIAAGAGLPSSAALDTDLLELAALVATAAVVISNDTGTAHLATAYGTPSVTLFGPVSPALWGPPQDRPQHVALWHGDQDCPGDPHGRDTDPRLARITVAEVVDAVSGLIGRAGSAHRSRPPPFEAARSFRSRTPASSSRNATARSSPSSGP